MPIATRFPEVEPAVNTRGAQPSPPRSGKRRTAEPEEQDFLDLAKSDPEEAAKRLLAEWERSWQDIRNYNEQWRVNLARSEGYLGARLDKVQDRQEAWIPLGAGPSITGLNKAARLSRRLRSALFADPPIPDVVPTTGQDLSADAAEFQERILQDESSEGRLGYAVLAADAFELAKDYGSGFVHFYIDPEGRGPEPVQLKAHPEATSADDPLLGGQAGTPVLKYVTAEGGLTDERYGQPLRQQFLPKLVATVRTGRHVRLLPNTARDLWDATACLVGAMMPLGDVKAAFKSVAAMEDDELAELVRYRPPKAEQLLAPEQRRYLQSAKISDTSLVFLLLRYALSTAQSPKGSYLALVGDNHMAHAGPWWDEEHDEPLDLPLTQFMQYRQFGNPYGTGSTETLGPGGELLALMLDAMLEHMDRFGDQKVFVPTTSSVRPEQLEAESHRYIPVSPQGQPVSEQVPDFPVVIEKMYGRISAEMDDESALGQAGQAHQLPNVKSARHFSANLQQVQVLLSDLRQNTARGLTRGWRVMAQQIRAFYTIPQLLRWAGEDGAYHVREWSGADLIGLGDVQIAQGSFTQMLPAQKATLARELFLTDRVLTPEQYKRIVFGQFNPIIAVQQDPHVQRVKRQIDRWLEGPQRPPAPSPPQPQEVMPSVSPAVQSAGAATAGAPANPAAAPPEPPNPYAQELSVVFDQRPTDDEPAVAAVRMQELGRVMAGAKFARFPPAWQAGLASAYQAARQAAQLPDAKMLQGLQQQVQQTQAELQQAQQKLAEPHVSFSASLADLDEQQTLALLAKQGIEVPPRQQPAPESLQHEQALKAMETDAEVQKQQLHVQGEVTKEQIRAASRTREYEAQRAHALRMAALTQRRGFGSTPSASRAP